MCKQCSEILSKYDCAAGTASTHIHLEARDLARDANEANDGAGFAGYNDWRVPTIVELETLVALDRINQSINTAVFPEIQLNSYWTTTFGADTYFTNAFTINFMNGSDNNSARAGVNYVRLVRGGS